MTVDAERVDELLAAGNVATCCTEGFRECTHEDVDFAGVDTEVVAHAATVGTDGTDRVSFVNEEIEL